MIRSLLIANRGEIACRIIRTARRLGIRTIAVHSDADARAMHVREADEAVHIGPSPARESYLIGDKIIAAAKATGAQAIHPGYGFLSENAGFAQAVTDAGLVWVGPKPSSILAMGLKDAAKKLMDKAGVPTTPGYLGEDQAPDVLRAKADGIGYPVLIKAVAGGGGKGMRKVNASSEFADMLESCKREAAASFGDDRVLIEKYIERPRHIEVQVFGDSHGNVVHLFERDCSLQRRHQKVIEEAPAPGMDEATRAAVCGAAVKAAQAVDYIGAGTVEFIADASEGLRPDRIWFMEMNTRLQVEHPVTEEISGQDLVEWQLRVASGETLPKRQDELSIRGWAMEARLYAEDPTHEFLPSTGRLDHFDLGRSIRIDTGVEEGDRISPYYDPMIAKLIASGATREDAIDSLLEALEQVEVWPVKTNAAFLARAAADPDFRAAAIDTAFIPARIDRLVPDASPSDGVWNLAANAFLATDFGARTAVPDPWASLPGFRSNASDDLRIALRHAGETRVVEVGANQDLDGVATANGDTMLVFSDGQAFAFTLPGAGGGPGAGAASDGVLLSPMPGRVLAVEIRQGDKVTKGQKLVTLEAMKMEHSLAAPFDGIVAELEAVAGGQVAEGSMLARIEKGED
ncbi:acetyl/propionyl/methylcrotonyl-CoA carboxylase subunit alpha [Sphingosinicella rhizophila]|uniref:Acetyl/propionyl/methylcrotonyl-CoA carboxylase subunit alpha n=1 Tax=Sphingosinicella rhizophila TaxID=3050082 RepID=A0ABU3Q2Y5_9SPHN|nr:acetyl/propionyl/methylcrotonyl-CoA carboxylase subunit alpha [Sphingosinicella sp. GR2756]MDT9597439.1 acetyl/propionyl/methylcrotonyl-CoA carboxylase subunit alpha [Sphingosinicella sp. GR2756]